MLKARSFGLIKSAFAALTLAFLMACQPQEMALLSPKQQAELAENELAMTDHSNLPLRRWLPEDAAQKHAVVLALHGFNDYSFAFDLMGSALAARGVAVYAYDQRGFGANHPQGVWPSSANLTRDLTLAIAAIKRAYPDVPLYLLGESMGAAVVIATCAQQPNCAPVDGLILSAPALWGDDTLSGFYQASLWVLAHLIPASEWTGEDLDIMASDNLEILYAMGDDPLVIKETRIDAVYGLVHLMAQAYVDIAQLKKPVLLLYGAKDQVIPPLPVAKAINRIEAPYSVGYYENGYHMLLRDLQREVVYKDILSWIDNRYRPLPSAADMGWREELLGVE